MRVLQLITVGLLLVTANYRTIAQSSETIRWYSYNEEFESYVPVTQPSNSVSFFVPLDDVSASLKVCLPPGASVFSENALVFTNMKSKLACWDLPVDSLVKVHAKDSIFVTVYSNREPLKELSTELIIPRQISPQDSNTAVMRSPTAKRDFKILGMLLCLLAIGLWRQQTNIHAVGYLNISVLFTSKSRDNTMYNTSYFQIENVQFFGLIALLFSYTFVYLYDSVPAFLFYYRADNLTSLVFTWLLNAMAYYFLLYGKFLVLGLIAQIFNFRNFRYVHHYDFTRFLYLGILLILGFLLVDFAIYGRLVEMTVLTVLILPLLLAIAHIIITFQKLNKLFSIKKLHLFSYLCVTEIIPIVLIIKISR